MRFLRLASTPWDDTADRPAAGTASGDPFVAMAGRREMDTDVALERSWPRPRAIGTELGLTVTVAVVDAAGHPVALARGKNWHGPYIAFGKARLAAAFRKPTAVLLRTVGGPPAVRAEPHRSHPRGVTLNPGGYPVFDGDECIGAVGVGGGSPDQDDLVARPAVEAVRRPTRPRMETPSGPCPNRRRRVPTCDDHGVGDAIVRRHTIWASVAAALRRRRQRRAGTAAECASPVSRPPRAGPDHGDQGASEPRPTRSRSSSRSAPSRRRSTRKRSSTASSRVFTGNVFETLLGRDRRRDHPVAGRVVHHSVNDTTWRFVLREGVKFHNGEDFNAEAAAYSVERIISKDYNTLRTSVHHRYHRREGRRCEHGRHHHRRHQRHAADPDDSLAMVPPKAAAEASFAEKPVGTGPTSSSSWDRGREITAKRFDGYWGTKPDDRRIRRPHHPERQTALSALQTGEVDLVLDLLPEQKVVGAEGHVGAGDRVQLHRVQHVPARARRIRGCGWPSTWRSTRRCWPKTIYDGEATPSNAQNLARACSASTRTSNRSSTTSKGRRSCSPMPATTFDADDRAQRPDRAAT